ncbi:MAG: IS66 family insertion sequence element accessory protein TnpB, partial [Dysgonamonadaceae bacterium]|nr:IS66 family insertion sequence element accessory protein TnpB [Dysgonamonadaceae bacterium]
MFSLNESQHYYLCCGGTDLRKGFDALCGVVSSQMGRNPLSGEAFIFMNKPHNTIKVLPEEKAELEQLAQTITYTRKAGKEKKEHPFRQALPENLERVEEIIEPDP